MKIRKNDTVVVISGDDKGKKARVLALAPDGRRLIVEGVNYIWKHVRRTQKTPAGGRVQKEAPIEPSKLMLFCPTCNKGVKVRRTGEAPSKTRVCRKCGGQV